MLSRNSGFNLDASPRFFHVHAQPARRHGDGMLNGTTRVMALPTQADSDGFAVPLAGSFLSFLVVRQVLYQGPLSGNTVPCRDINREAAVTGATAIGDVSAFLRRHTHLATAGTQLGPERQTRQDTKAMIDGRGRSPPNWQYRKQGWQPDTSVNRNGETSGAHLQAKTAFVLSRDHFYSRPCL